MKSTNEEAMELGMYLYSIFINAYESNDNLENQNQEILAKFPDFKKKLDKIIANHTTY
jgi:hypothetical protein